MSRYYYRWDSGATYHALEGEEHLDAAKQLEDEFAQACELVPLGLESVPPFDGCVTGLDDPDDGVVLHLAAEAGPPDLLMVQVRCHRTWMWIEGGTAWATTRLRHGRPGGDRARHRGRRGRHADDGES